MSLLFRKRVLTLAFPALVMVALVAFAGCGSTSTGSGDTTSPTATSASVASPTVAATDTTGSTENQVNVSNFQFSPATLTVKAGTTVTWKGVSGSHTVTSDAGAPMAFDQSISQGDTVKVTFATAGTYKYHCSIHAQMHGTIIVTS